MCQIRESFVSSGFKTLQLLFGTLGFFFSVLMEKEPITAKFNSNCCVPNMISGIPEEKSVSDSNRKFDMTCWSRSYNLTVEPEMSSFYGLEESSLELSD